MEKLNVKTFEQIINMAGLDEDGMYLKIRKCSYVLVEKSSFVEQVVDLRLAMWYLQVPSVQTLWWLITWRATERKFKDLWGNLTRLLPGIITLILWPVSRTRQVKTLRNVQERRLGVNFIKISCKAFTCPNAKSAKRYWQLDWFFTLLVSALIKAVHKHVGEIDPRCVLENKQTSHWHILFCGKILFISKAELSHELWISFYTSYISWSSTSINGLL